MEEEVATKPKRRKLVIPRRVPSIVVVVPPPNYTTPDKTTCVECGCFPPLEPYQKNKKLLPCLRTPPTLYELTAVIVDKLVLPAAFGWTEEDVATWMEEDVGFPQYKGSIVNNYINGMRLLTLEDPSMIAAIGINIFEHIKIISAKVRKLFGVEIIRFCRSVGLPPRKPLTHCTWFKSRTGPSWGIHVNWTRCDILRWMKIIMPEPIYMDHWDMVWYQRPDFPKVKFGRIKPKFGYLERIPHYTKPREEMYRDVMIPRKFRFETGIHEAHQYIWVQRRVVPKKEVKKKKRVILPRETGLFPDKITLEGKHGEGLILARRKMPKPKFFV